MAQCGTPHPTYQLLIGFGRIPKPVLGTSGGRVPPVPRGYATVPFLCQISL